MDKEIITSKEFVRRVNNTFKWNVNYRHFTKNQIKNRLIKFYIIKEG